MVDWIQGNKFQKLAKFTYAPAKLNFYDYAKIPNNLDLNLLQDGDMIYCVGFNYYKKGLLETIKNTKKVILISHNCDQCIDDSYEIPDNVVKWYSININTENPKLEAIPIGLQNDIWFPEMKKKEKMIQKLQEKRNLKNLLYINHTTAKDIYDKYERRKPYELFEGKYWATAIKDVLGNGLGFNRYLDNIYNHKFTICPLGNGIDTHRMWEVLYMGSVPIVRDHVNFRFYKDLPICFVKNWEEITEYFLTNWLIENHDTKWNMDMLKFEYWKQKILRTENEGYNT